MGFNLRGQKVYHKKFGEGLITNQTVDSILVSFSHENKRFVYPDAFKDFLVAEQLLLNEAINCEIAEKEEKEALLAQKQEQKNREMNLKNSTAKMSTSEPRNARTLSHQKGPQGQQYYFVFQNKSFDAEQRGSFLWAPKSNYNGRSVSHWKLMQDVKAGDVIFHSFNKNIVAISIAISNCYSSGQPDNLKQEHLWEDEGWRVDSRYTLIRYPVVTSDYMTTILELQPEQYAPFNVLGRGNTGYLFASNYALSKFLFDILLASNPFLNEIAEQAGL